MNIENPEFKIHRLDSVESTNKHCEALDLAQVEDFTCYWALEQTAGIGQRGNHWHSSPGKNLTFSLVLHPTFLPAARQFLLTQALSLGVVDMIEGIDRRDGTERVGKSAAAKPTPSIHSCLFIKWPNDIYLAGGKVCGTLVSTRLQGDCIASAVCGIGLNINEREFPEWVPHPTSLSLTTGKEYDLEFLLHRLLGCLHQRYLLLKSGLAPQEEYLSRLMKLGVEARYLYHNEEIRATITGVDPFGHLLLTAADGRHLRCAMKEIVFLS